jgi:glycosyltransferase involved in cell wall biosynthesis
MKWWEGNNKYTKDGIQYEAICKYYPLYHNERRSIKQAVIFALSCLKLITKRFDYMDVDHIPHLVLFTTKFVCLVRRKTLIVTWHEVWGREYWKKYLGNIWGEIAYMIEYVTSRLPDKIVSVSDHTTLQLENILKVKGNVYTIPNAIDLDIINKAPTSVEVSDVIFAGRLLPNKNVDVLLKAVNELKNNNIDCKTFIVGEGPELESLKDLSTKLGLDNQVKFFGFVKDHSDLHALMKSSKVFVLPSNREGFGIVVIEANATGLPVITVNSSANAAKDLVNSGENGLVCDLDYKSIAKAIRKQLESNKDKAYYMEYSKKYDWNTVFPLILNLYK